MKIYIRAAVVDLADEDGEVIEDLAENPNTRPSVLKRIAEECQDNLAIMETLARNPNLPDDVIQILLGLDNYWVVYHLFQNNNVPVSNLEELAESPEPRTRELVAKCPNTPEFVLTKLLKDKAVDVRDAAYKNPNTPKSSMAATNVLKLSAPTRKHLAYASDTSPEILSKLAYKDKSDDIRGAALENPNMPSNVLWEVINGEGPFQGYKYINILRNNVACNDKCTTEMLDRLVEIGVSIDHWYMLSHVANKPNLSERACEVLADYDYQSVRWALAENKTVPADILRKLAEDKVPEVRRAAKATLRKRHL